MNEPPINLIIDGALYLLGALIIAFGVALVLVTDLGPSTWDTLHHAIRSVTPPFLTFGAAMVIVTSILSLFIIVVQKSFRYLFMIVPFLLVGAFLDFFELIVFADFEPEGWLRFALYAYGLFSVPLGASLHILSRFPAGVYDEFMLAIMKVLGTSRFALVRVIMEASFVLLAVLITGYFKGTLGALHFGTLLFVVLSGPLLKFYITLLRRIPVWKSID